MVGVAMISTALLFDAVIGNVQEKAMREYRANNVEVVLYSYGIGFVYLLVILIVSGDLLPSVRFCATVSVSLLLHCLHELCANVCRLDYLICLSFFCFISVSHSNVWLCISIQPIGIFGHSICTHAS